MLKQLIIIFLLFSTINAQNIKPFSKFVSTGFVNDFVIHKNTLYVANDEGIVDIFDIKTRKITKQILLPPLTSSIGKKVPAVILSVDHLNGKTLILSVGKNSYRNIWIYENYELKQIINEEKRLTIKEARFIDDEKIFFGSLASDITLYDTGESYNLYNLHVADSAMGDMVLSKDKKTVSLADESGTVTILDIKSSKVLKTLSSVNVDNIFKLATANGVVITAGQDRRVGVYPKNQKPYYIKSNFLVFCVGISPNGKTGIYSSGQESDLQLFNIKSKVKGNRLVGHSGVVNKIIFISENELFSSARDNTIFYWKIK